MAETGKPLDTTAAEAYEKFFVPSLNAPATVAPISSPAYIG